MFLHVFLLSFSCFCTLCATLGMISFHWWQNIHQVANWMANVYSSSCAINGKLYSCALEWYTCLRYAHIHESHGCNPFSDLIFVKNCVSEMSMNVNASNSELQFFFFFSLAFSSRPPMLLYMILLRRILVYNSILTIYTSENCAPHFMRKP